MRLLSILPTLLSLLAMECSAQNVLMFGNSYTEYNNLADLLQNLMQTQHPTNTVDNVTSGGKKIGWHHSNAVATANSDHANKLANLVAGDVLILQDQSQVPSCTCFAEYPASLNGTKAIRMAMPAGTDMMMFQTWGRQDGLDRNSFNNCFSQMTDNLREGYEAYRDNALTSGAGDVYIAPVGFAFKKLHDEELCNPDPSAPTCTASQSGITTGCNPVEGSDFETLYAGDGSHPSIRGSYLAACVMFTSITGVSPVGLPGPGDIDAAKILKLQEAAESVVLLDSENLGYTYSWSGGPVVPTPVPVDPTSAPVDPTSAPVDPTSAPAVPIPTEAPVSDWETCDDHATATFTHHNKQKTCGWLRYRGRNFRNSKCSDPAIASLCEETCGLCSDSCEDDASAVFDVNNRVTGKTCKWLASSVSRTNLYCTEGNDAFYYCRETCESCHESFGSFPSAAPSAELGDPLADGICQDDDAATFLWGNVAKTCKWLRRQANRPDRKATVCVPENDAYWACEATCDRCGM